VIRPPLVPGFLAVRTPATEKYGGRGDVGSGALLIFETRSDHGDQSVLCGIDCIGVIGPIDGDGYGVFGLNEPPRVTVRWRRFVAGALRTHPVRCWDTGEKMITRRL